MKTNEYDRLGPSIARLRSRSRIGNPDQLNLGADQVDPRRHKRKFLNFRRFLYYANEARPIRNSYECFSMDLFIPGRPLVVFPADRDRREGPGPRQGDACGQVDGRGRLPNPPFWLAMAMIRA